MCGVVGGISFRGTFFPSKEELMAAADYLKFRGPDDAGEIFFDQASVKVALAHRRLSIIDLSSNGHQPMMSSSGKSCIVFNGEIYNYKLLRSELVARKFLFNTQSDTEVILNSFECWGIEGTLARLDGMFAFALYDLENEALILARDRFGKKPLYYFVRSGQLAFSSDIRGFDGIRSIPKSIDLHALGYFFAELSTPHEHSIWQDIKKLKPANYLQFDVSGISRYKTYWNARSEGVCHLNRTELVERADEMLSAAVKKRLVADVKVGALLSGGIDSSLVVAKMAEHCSSVKTYSVGFNEAAFNELPYARSVASVFATDHTEILMQPDSLLEINKLIIEFGEPFADVSMIPTYLISKEISKTEKVVLGGDGGDELFGGYYSYYFAHKFDLVKKYGSFYPIARMLNQIYPSYRADFLVRLLKQAGRPRYSLLNRNLGFDTLGLKQLFNDDRFFAALDREHEQIWEGFSVNSRHDLINVMSASLKTRLLNDYLVKIDRATMYASLEMRSPFLDRDLSEFASTLTPEQLLNRGETKSVLKDLALKYFPPDFVYRNKMGFAVPVGEWFKGKLTQSLQEIVLDGRQNLIGLDYPHIEQVIKDHCSGVSDHTHKLWALYVFHIWANSQ